MPDLSRPETEMMPTFENQTLYLLQTTGSHSIRGQYSTEGQDTTHSGSSAGGVPVHNPYQHTIQAQAHQSQAHPRRLHLLHLPRVPPPKRRQLILRTN